MVTVLVAVPAFLLSPVLFPPAEGGFEPTASQLPYFLFLGASDGVLLCLGVSFLLFGYPVLRKVSYSRARTWAIYLSIGHLMIYWWPHLGMYASTGLDLQGLLYIDYVFHVPWRSPASSWPTAPSRLLRTGCASAPCTRNRYHVAKTVWPGAQHGSASGTNRSHSLF